MKKILTALLLLVPELSTAGPAGPPSGAPVYNQAAYQLNAQYNVSSGTVKNTLTAGTAVVSGSATASAFFGDGSHLTGITGGISTGVVTTSALSGTGQSASPLSVNSSSVAVLSGGLVQNFELDSSSVTKQGFVSLSNLSGNVPANRVDLSTVTTQLNLVAASTTTLQSVKASTGTCTLPNFPITLNGGNVVCQQPSNITGNAATVTTNANLTGPVTSVGNTTTIVGPIPTSAVDLSTVTAQFNKVAVDTTSLASGGATTYVHVAGDTMTGQLTSLSTITVRGSSFSVGSSSFVVSGGSATVVYLMTARAFSGDGSALTNLPTSTNPGISTGAVTTAALTGNGQSSSPLGVNSSSVAVYGSDGSLSASGKINSGVGYFLSNSTFAYQDSSTNLLVGVTAGGGFANSGADNTAVGASAGGNIVSGSRNTLLGSAAGLSANIHNVSGNDNTAVGYHAGDFLGSGGFNTLLGSNADAGITSATHNVCVGYNSCANLASGTGNVMIGDQVAGGVSNESHKLYIEGDGSAPLIYGDFSARLVGINTSSPGTTLDVAGASTIRGQETVTSTVTVQGSAFSVGTSSFSVSGGSATVAYQLTFGSLNGPISTSNIDLSTVTTRFNNVAVSTTNLASGSATTYLLVSGGTLTGQVTSQSTITIQGNSFSVGGSTFIVGGGSVSISGTKFVVDNTGNLVKINNVVTSFPSSQGSLGNVLQNDGAGVLTWVGSLTDTNGALSVKYNTRILENSSGNTDTLNWNSGILYGVGSGNAGRNVIDWGNSKLQAWDNPNNANRTPLDWSALGNLVIGASGATGTLVTISSDVVSSGSKFSIGGSSFSVSGGSATVAYLMTARAFSGDGSALTGVTAGVSTGVVTTAALSGNGNSSSPLSVVSSSVAVLNSSGFVLNSQIDPSSVTKQGFVTLANLTGSVPTSRIDLSTVTNQFNQVASDTTTLRNNVAASTTTLANNVAVSTTNLASGSSTTYLLVNGSNGMTGQFTTLSSATIKGVFSVEGSTFSIGLATATFGVPVAFSSGIFAGSGSTTTITPAGFAVGLASGSVAVNSSTCTQGSALTSFSTDTIGGYFLTNKGDAINATCIFMNGSVLNTPVYGLYIGSTLICAANDTAAGNLHIIEAVGRLVSVNPGQILWTCTGYKETTSAAAVDAPNQLIGNTPVAFDNTLSQTFHCQASRVSGGNINFVDSNISKAAR